MLLLLSAESVLSKSEGNANHLRARSRSLFVSPFDAEGCSGKEPCYTLSDYLEDDGVWFTSDTAFFFLPGNHTVSKHRSLIIKQVENLAMSGVSDSSGVPAVRIYCEGKLDFQFKLIRNLSISDVEFIECGSDEPTSDGGMQAAIRCDEVYDLTIRNVNIRESYGYGIVGANILGMSAIVDCVFASNGWRVTKSKNQKPMGGNAIFLFADSYKGADLLAHSFNITNCEFTNGTTTEAWKPYMGPLKLGGGSGLALFIYHNNFNSYNLSIAISGCYFHDNVAPKGANMLMVVDLVSQENWSYLYTVTIMNSDFYNGKATFEGGAVYVDSFQSKQVAASLIMAFINSTFRHNTASKGGAFFVKAKRTKLKEFDGIIGIRMENSHFNQNKASIGGSIYARLTALLSYSAEVHITQADAVHFNITKCIFSQNKATSSGGGIHLFLDPGDIPGPDDPYYISVKYNLLTKVTISFCLFSENIAETGSVIIINGNERELLSFVSANFLCYQANVINYIVIQNTTFENNSCTGDVICKSESAVLHLHSVQDCRLINCQFADNRASAIYANSSYLYLHGSINFTRNVARLGGALHLECSSLGQSIVHLSTMYISNNRATQYGGAIAVEDNCVHYSTCFFQMPSTEIQTYLIFMENNTAEIAGDSVYGGSLESCILLDSVNHTQKLNHSLFHHTFGLNDLYSESVISSSPYLVCLCTSGSVGDGCKTLEHTEAFPGETVILSAATTGQYEGASPAIVRSTVKTLDNEAWEMGQRQEIQALGRKCGNLSYLILTLARYVEVHLQVESSQGSLQPPSILSVTFKDCPLGFELSNIPPHVCICASHLEKSRVRCNIDTQTFQHQGNVWIGKQSNNIAIHTSCPFDYCKPNFSDINLRNQDEQCANDRSGILCGRCAQGLSIMLGSTRCLQCSSYYLFLLIPFAVAGILLVLVLFCCNLTVSTGTINGLIFYANIIWRNQSIFFPQGHPSFLVHLSRIFTAWVNLDLGIETCFCRGLDNYTKTWLQFLFPLYTWVLAGSIVYFHKRSVLVSKVFKSNTLPILSTLLLMSYAKILSAAFDALSSVSVTTKNGTSSLLWLLDANVSFFKGRHIPLFGMAMVAILFYVIPFTVLLFLAPFLQAKSTKRWLQWMSKFKPFLDSYQVPYKDKFRYWPGLMLLIRLTLFILFSANSLGDPRLNLFAVIVITSMIPTILYCYNTGDVYQKHMVQLLKTFFLLNLGIFTTASLFLRLTEAVPSKQVYLTSIMIGSAIVIFSFILAYHCYQEIKKFSTTISLMKHLGLWKPKTSELTCTQQRNSDTAEHHPTVTVIELQLH